MCRALNPASRATPSARSAATKRSRQAERGRVVAEAELVEGGRGIGRGVLEGDEPRNLQRFHETGARFGAAARSSPVACGAVGRSACGLEFAQRAHCWRPRCNQSRTLMERRIAKRSAPPRPAASDFDPPKLSTPTSPRIRPRCRPRCARRLGRVFHHADTVPLRNRHHRAQGDDPTMQMRADDRFRSRRDGGFEISRIELPAIRVNVDKNGLCASAWTVRKFDS